MQKHSQLFSVTTMCHVLNVNRSGYYAWHNKPASALALSNAVLLDEIKQSFAASGNIYGSPRVYRDCKAAGLVCSQNRVARLMHQVNLQAVRGYRRARYKVGKPATTAPNRLRQVFVASAPDEVWVTDITQIYTHEGWLYIAVVIDLYSRAVVGWSMQPHIRTEY